MAEAELGSAGAVAAEAADVIAATSDQSVPLSTLTRGQRGQVISISSDSTFLARLQALGFVPGSLVKVRQKAPLQDPVEYEVRGSRFCLRREDAQHIMVSVTPT